MMISIMKMFKLQRFLHQLSYFHITVDCTGPSLYFLGFTHHLISLRLRGERIIYVQLGEDSICHTDSSYLPQLQGDKVILILRTEQFYGSCSWAAAFIMSRIIT